MILTLTDNEGVVLDSTDVDINEWNEARANYFLAQIILGRLQAGESQ